MTNIYQYLSDKLTSDSYVNAVYESMGEGEINELSTNVRGVDYPCVVCELGDDGVLNMRDMFLESSVRLLYVIDQWSVRDYSRRSQILTETKAKGLEILRQLQLDARDLGDPMFGIDFSAVNFYKVAPGNNTLGYCFALKINNH